MDQLFVRILHLLVRLLKRLSTTGCKEDKQPHFEVERKYRLSQDEFDTLPARLRQDGFVRAGRMIMTDTFLPAENDGELMRLRDEVSETGRSITILTTKRWVEVAGDRERKESESEGIDSTTRECLLSLGQRLQASTGKKKERELPSYTKERTTFSGYRDRFTVTVALDLASGLGEYSGTYLEVEVIVFSEQEVARARAFVEGFGKELLRDERQMAISYREMLMRSCS